MIHDRPDPFPPKMPGITSFIKHALSGPGSWESIHHNKHEQSWERTQPPLHSIKKKEKAWDGTLLCPPPVYSLRHSL